MGDRYGADSGAVSCKVPGCEVTYGSGEYPGVLARLDNGEIDFALVEGFYKKNEYDYLHYSTERYVAVCSPFYPFSKKPERLEDLFGERLLLREPGSGTREVLGKRHLDSQNYGTEDFVRTAGNRQFTCD